MVRAGASYGVGTLAIMETADHLAALAREGELMASVAARADLETAIPTCPEWRMRDLIRHVGDVHRWAAAHVAQKRPGPIGPDELAAVAGPLPDDADLLDWFRQGHADLLRTLRTADPDTQCWSFMPAPSPVAFWARRQAHETGIHRADSESPGGPAGITPFDTEFAVDGVEEFLFGRFLGTPDGDQVEPRSLQLHATDAGTDWLIRLDEQVEVRREAGAADCAVRAPASDLHLLLWNRRPAEGLDVQGDPSVLDFWRSTVQVHWSRSR